MSLSTSPQTGAYQAVLAAPFGLIGVRTRDDQLCSVDFLPPGSAESMAPADAFSREVAAQFEQYLRDPHWKFSIPLTEEGTAFQRSVWEVLRSIPAGKTRTYGDVAAQLGSAARAIGGACRANPMPIFTPCHRVVAQQGFGGFSGRTRGWEVNVKRWLLAHECAAART